MKNLTLVALLALGAVACSKDTPRPAEAEAETSASVETPAANAAASADDDTLEPEAPKVEEGEDHDESAPHSH